MKLAHLMLSIIFAVSVFAQTPADQKPADATKQQPTPTKRLFIADYIISGAVGSAHTDTTGNTYGSAAAVGRNISLATLEQRFLRETTERMIGDRAYAALLDALVQRVAVVRR